jgi:hypothetical protein
MRPAVWDAARLRRVANAVPEMWRSESVNCCLQGNAYIQNCLRDIVLISLEKRPSREFGAILRNCHWAGVMRLAVPV